LWLGRAVGLITCGAAALPGTFSNSYCRYPCRTGLTMIADRHGLINFVIPRMAKTARDSTKDLRPAKTVRDEGARLTAKGKPRKRNPAPGTPVVVRLQPHELDLLDGWMVEQDDIPETRQEAIRRLIIMVCKED